MYLIKFPAMEVSSLGSFSNFSILLVFKSSLFNPPLYVPIQRLSKLSAYSLNMKLSLIELSPPSE